jgi:hypothetical protein
MSVFSPRANINETALFHLSLSDGFSVWAIFIIAGGGHAGGVGDKMGGRMAIDSQRFCKARRAGA